MRKAMLLSAAITLCAALAMAQDTPSTAGSGQNGATSSTTSQTTSSDQNATGNSIQGCLTGSSGNYMLTNASGVSYKVQGDDSQLSANVNKQVEVMGTVGSSASASAGNSPDTSAPNGSAAGEANANAGSSSSGSTGATATATATKTITATSVKAVGDSCSNSK
jgi:hypothetical protein